jgi:hypothetical protein
VTIASSVMLRGRHTVAAKWQTAFSKLDGVGEQGKEVAEKVKETARAVAPTGGGSSRS